MQPTSPPRSGIRSSEDGFLLLGAIVAIALVLIVLAIAAPRVARSLRRDREVEAVHRGNQYVRAIQLYYRKFGHYPGTIDQLENSNNIRFLRQRYADPITNQDDFITIPVGHNKTTVKTFFGEPLAGLPTAGVGSVSSMLSPGQGTPVAGGTPGDPSAGGTFGRSGFGAGSSGSAPSTGFGSAATGSNSSDPAAGGAAAGASTSGAPGATGTAAAGGSSTSPFGSGVGSQSATSFSGSAQPFMGVSIGAHGDSMVEFNQQPTYETWEFLYDPRLDALKAKAAALNGGLGSVPANSLGNSVTQPGATGAFGAPGSPGTSGTQGTTPGATTPTGTQPTGNSAPNQQ